MCVVHTLLHKWFFHTAKSDFDFFILPKVIFHFSRTDAYVICRRELMWSARKIKIRKKELKKRSKTLAVTHPPAATGLLQLLPSDPSGACPPVAHPLLPCFPRYRAPPVAAPVLHLPPTSDLRGSEQGMAVAAGFGRGEGRPYHLRAPLAAVARS